MPSEIERFENAIAQELAVASPPSDNGGKTTLVTSAHVAISDEASVEILAESVHRIDRCSVNGMEISSADKMHRSWASSRRHFVTV